jgi:hypothetical protein
MDNERIDSRALSRGEQILDGYYLGDPGISRKEAKEALIRQIRAKQQLRQRNPSIPFSYTPIDRARMKDLGVDPDKVSG